MKIKNFTETSASGTLVLKSHLVDKTIRGNRYSVMIKSSLEHEGKYAVYVWKNTNPNEYVFSHGNHRAKAVLGVLKQFNIKI